MWTKKQLETAYIKQSRQIFELEEQGGRYLEALENIQNIQEFHRETKDIEVLETVREALGGGHNE